MRPAARAAGDGRRSSSTPALFIGLVVACAIVYSYVGADATGLFRASKSRSLQGEQIDLSRLNADVFKGKDFQRIPPSRSAARTPPSTPSNSPGGTPPASASSSAASTPANTPSKSPAAPPKAAEARKAESVPAKQADDDPKKLAELYPSRKPLPPQPPADDFRSHPNKYLMLVQGQEGFGAWNDQIWEMLDLARTLNRSFVEPCVRNSCLEPCRCGAVHDVRVHDADLGQFDEGKDPLNLKFDPYPCEPYTGHMRAQVGWSWPLSVYLDMAALKAYYPHIVRYQDWCDNVMSKDTSVDVMEKDKRWIVTQGAFCGELHEHWCDMGQTKLIGDFYFEKFEFGRPGTVPDTGMMDRLHNEPYHTIFYYGYYR